MIRELYVPIYGATILFMIETTDVEIDEFLRKDTNKSKFTNKEINSIVFDIADTKGVAGTTMTLDKGGEYVVFIRDAHFAYYSMHELYHVADRILKHRGVEHTDDDEAYAYMVGWLAQEYKEMLKEL